jgi:hypothetical protein
MGHIYDTSMGHYKWYLATCNKLSYSVVVAVVGLVAVGGGGLGGGSFETYTNRNFNAKA